MEFGKIQCRIQQIVLRQKGKLDQELKRRGGLGQVRRKG